MLFKLGDIYNRKEVTWDNVYQKDVYPSFSRLRIGCQEREIPLILDLCRAMDGPFGVLHVLLVSRVGKESGRYQNSNSLSYEELELFLYEHQTYFERDGRQHLWVVSLIGEGQFIFDNHNFIYAYGDLEAQISMLKSKGFVEDSLVIPEPHTHNYHLEFDEQEQSVHMAFEWLFSSLQDSDDP